jgi:hypothetical protein
MRFPSIDALATRARLVLVRFPWVLAVGVVAATAAIIGLERHDDEFWARFALVAALGLPLTVALSLLGERLRLLGWKRTALLAVGVLFLIWFFQVWHGPDRKDDMIRYVQLSLGLHLTVAFLPFLPAGGRGGFWQYNRTLFESFLRAVLFSAVLFLGLAIALVALDKLFGLDVPEQSYAQLWMILALVVNTWIFLSGIPLDFAELEQSSVYPRGLKVFTQYILTPLVAVYLVILTMYLVKIVITGSWPNGWIGYLVSSVAVTGILGFLLVDPLRHHPEEGWIRTYARWLFVGLIPAAIMFLLALYKRIDPYGLTELRFLGVLLGAWLLGIAVLYTLRRDFGIQIIPVSLAVLLLITLFGPISATSFSLRSQTGRLAALLQSNHLLDQPGSATRSVSDTDRREISAALRFILERHAGDRLLPIFGGTLPGNVVLRDSTAVERDSTSARLLRALGAQYVPESWNGSGYFSFQVRSDSTATPIDGYAFAIALSGADSTNLTAGKDSLRIVFDSQTIAVRVMRQADTLLLFPVGALVDTLLSPAGGGYTEFAPGRMRVGAAGDQYEGMLALEWLTGTRLDAQPHVRGWRGTLYFGAKRSGGGAGSPTPGDR